jgi:hypothetical protein
LFHVHFGISGSVPKFLRRWSGFVLCDERIDDIEVAFRRRGWQWWWRSWSRERSWSSNRSGRIFISEQLKRRCVIATGESLSLGGLIYHFRTLCSRRWTSGCCTFLRRSFRLKG